VPFTVADRLSKDKTKDVTSSQSDVLIQRKVDTDSSKHKTKDQTSSLSDVLVQRKVRVHQSLNPKLKKLLQCIKCVQVRLFA
jgi:hypothetical protein